MSSPLIILDTDFLSSFLKIGQLALVRGFYQVERLVIPSSVYREVSQTSLLQRLAEISWLQVETPESRTLEELSMQDSIRDLGAGETEAIALALQRPGSRLLMSDNRARLEAADREVQVVNIPAFLLACKISGFLSRDQIAEIARDLQERDRYGFRKEVLARLLD